ncbi:hypothetical protein M3Y97_01085900 [Aphelenchoides bicaudatus]|nr:hypothetical protein M3Y97_01085900 [Aphelenchoides bicaudatus]
MWLEVLIGALIGTTAFSLLFSLPLYLLVLLVVIRNRNVEPFNSEFFTIFIALGFVDISCYLLFLTKKVFFLGYVPEVLQPFNEPNKIASFFYYPFWVFAFLQYQFTFILSLNRFICITFPNFYERNWNSTLTRQILVICILYSLLISLPVPFSHCQITMYTTEVENTTYTLYYGPMTTNKMTESYLKFLWACHVYGLMISSVLFYGVMLRKLRSTKLIDNRKRLELQMFYIGLMIFLLNFVFTVYFFVRDFLPSRASTNVHLHEWLLYFISDIYDLPNGIMLWCTSSSIRKLVLEPLANQYPWISRIVYGAGVGPHTTRLFTPTGKYRNATAKLPMNEIS